MAVQDTGEAAQDTNPLYPQIGATQDQQEQMAVIQCSKQVMLVRQLHPSLQPGRLRHKVKS